LLLYALLLLLLFVAHVLETEFLDLFDDGTQMVHEAFVFNLVPVKIAPIFALNTSDHLVS
jgi:hypothetical protein